MHITDLPIRAKFIVIFAAFMIISLILAVVGFVGLSAAQKISDDTYVNQTVPSETINKICKDLLIVSSCFDESILAGNANDAKPFYDEVQKITQGMPALIAAYEPTIVTDEERAAFDSASKIYNEVLGNDAPKFFALISDGKIKEANEMMSEMDDDITQMLDGFDEYNVPII